MKHPLETLPSHFRKPLFWVFLLATLALFVLFRFLNAPLITPAASGGIVTFELAGSPTRAQSILDSWDARAKLFASFGLGLDYLFMPLYSLALMLGTLLAAGRHKGWQYVTGAVAGWGALAAAVFDAVENLALWRQLLGEAFSYWPKVAAVCAQLKFFLLLLGMVYMIFGFIWRTKTKGAERDG